MSKSNERGGHLLKFSYRGSVVQISYGPDFRYDDIIAKVIEHFRIPQDNLTVVQITNKFGYILEKQLFENFILLFPNPEITFYVRRSCERTKTAIKEEFENKTNNNNYNNNSCIRRTTNSNHLLKRRLVNDFDDLDSSYGAPVKRQNCFIGYLPKELCSIVEHKQTTRKHSSPHYGQTNGTSNIRSLRPKYTPILLNRLRNRSLRI